jgi:HSP20 family molecular chaperone IbpA
VEITYEGENKTYLIEIEGAQPLRVYLPRTVNTDKITAKLKKGILTIEAPILNTDKQIQIQ